MIGIGWLDYALAVAAVYRVAYMVALETGPFELCAKLRRAATKAPLWVQEGLGCPLCISFWLGLLAGIAATGEFLHGVAYGLGIAGGVLIVHKVVHRD